MFSSEQWLANSGADFYNGVATQSLRFDDGSSPYLTKTFSAGTSTGSGATCTFSCWIKRSTITNADQWFFTAGSSSPAWLIGFRANDNLAFGDDDGNPFVTVTSRVFRDTSAWYHIVLRVKTSESANADKYKFYVNGELQATTFSGSPANTLFGTNVIHNIGRYPTGSAYFDGYMSDLNFVDGLALDHTNFGEAKNGVWIPKEPDVSEYGTNGFRFKYIGTGTATSSGAVTNPTNIGDDSSGKNNHFAVSGLVSSDSNMPDSPENNFCTLNPNIRPYTVTPAETVSDGNLNAFFNSSGVSGSYWSTFLLTSGKWYYEVLVSSAGGNADVGISNSPNFAGRGTYASDARSKGYFYQKDGQKGIDNTFSSYGATYTTNNIIGCAFDLDNNTITFYKDNASQGEITSVATSEDGFIPAIEGFNGARLIANFGQDGSFAGTLTGTAIGDETDGNGYGLFKYAPPSGFLSLCTANLEEPTIGANSDTQSTDHFGILTYTGDGAQTRTITSGASGIGGVMDFKPDWVVQKIRIGTTQGAGNWDSTRGFAGANALDWSDTTAEGTWVGASSAGYGFVSGVDDNDVSLNDGTSATTGGFVNTSGRTYVLWNWKAGGEPTATNSAGAGNTPTAGSVKIDGANLGSALAGSIPATKLSANTTAGFSIVTYTGTGTAGTVAHGLGAIPNMYMVKCLDNSASSDHWYVYHAGIASNAEDYEIYLNLTARAYENNNYPWNETKPTNSVFSIKTLQDVNQSSKLYVAYCFAEVEGYSKFGSYTGNNDPDGSMIFTNFSPAFVMIKSTVQTESWDMHDNARNTFNVNDKSLLANAVNGENAVGVARQQLDFLSNGFKLRNQGDANPSINNEATTYIYMAFSEAPFKYANAK